VSDAALPWRANLTDTNFATFGLRKTACISSDTPDLPRGDPMA